MQVTTATKRTTETLTICKKWIITMKHYITVYILMVYSVYITL